VQEAKWLPEQRGGLTKHVPKSQSLSSAQAKLEPFEQRKLRSTPQVPLGIPVSNESRSRPPEQQLQASVIVVVVVLGVVVVDVLVVVGTPGHDPGGA
jgi:hypothetical protein